MDRFYNIVVIVAIVILILCLIAVGIMLQNKKEETIFPEKVSPCPDGWDVDSSGGCTVPAVGHINLPNDSRIFNYDTKIWKRTANANASVLNGVNTDTLTNAGTIYLAETSRCNKKKWAKDNGIIWDGASNYNQDC